MTTPLVDGDCLVYEVASVGQYKENPEDEEYQLRPWSWVEETIDGKIKDICEAVEATTAPVVFLTGDQYLWNMKRRLRPSLPIYEPNFRIERAKLRVYKGTRKSDKPYYYNSVRTYLLVHYNAYISIGCEADDEMAMAQTKAQAEGRDTIICTRDKDLRQVPGWHYGWECGKQAEFGPTEYDKLGTVQLDRSLSSPKIVGGGFAFFCSQLLTGDPVDCIGGLPKYGPVKVASILDSCGTTAELMDRVRREYQLVYPDDWKDQLREQADLLWMVRRRDAEGRLMMFNPKEDV